MRALRFGSGSGLNALRFATQSGGVPSGAEWLERVRGLERIGYGTVAMPDHVVGGSWAPLPALAAAAIATSTIRLGTLVLANDFRNPLLLAREVATLDVLSGGRVEFGLGAGWLDRDYESLGISFDRGRVRVERLAEAVTLMKRLFAEEEVSFAGRYYRFDKARCQPRTVQRPRPPLLIAGGGPMLLGLAAKEADIAAVVPVVGRRGEVREDREVGLEATREKVSYVRDAAGDRFGEIELSMFLDVVLTDDRDKAIAEIAERRQVSRDRVASSVYGPIGTIDDVRAHILRMRDAVGVTYFCLRGPHVEELAPLVRELTGK